MEFTLYNTAIGTTKENTARIVVRVREAAMIFDCCRNLMRGSSDFKDKSYSRPRVLGNCVEGMRPRAAYRRGEELKTYRI